MGDSSNAGNLARCFSVIELIQTDVSRYPFHQQPPTYLRAHRYRYWFTEAKADGSVSSLRFSVRVLKSNPIPLTGLCLQFLPTEVVEEGLRCRVLPFSTLGPQLLREYAESARTEGKLTLHFYCPHFINDFIRISSRRLLLSIVLITYLVCRTKRLCGACPTRLLLRLSGGCGPRCEESPLPR